MDDKNTLYCPYCGQEYVKGMGFCSRCGNYLDENRVCDYYNENSESKAVESDYDYSLSEVEEKTEAEIIANKVKIKNKKQLLEEKRASNSKKGSFKNLDDKKLNEEVKNHLSHSKGTGGRGNKIGRASCRERVYGMV